MHSNIRATYDVAGGLGIPRFRLLASVCLVPICVFATIGETALAADIDTGNPDVSVRWDNTIKYTSMYRLGEPSQAVAGSTPNNNLDDGDLNFDKGFVSNRGDLLTELDVAWRRTYGARVSAAAWYDDAYNGSNDNKSPGTANNLNHANNKFAKETRDVAGRRVELLDAFVYGSFETPADTALTLRMGQFTSLYGETLFMGANGIAAAQGPTDINKLLSVPSAQFKEIAMPVPQMSAKLQLNDAVSVGGYYQFQWRANRMPPVGSYFSVGDIGADGEEVLYPAGGGPGGIYFDHTDNVDARDSGQGGLMTKFKVGGNFELGLYGARFHAKDAKVYVTPKGAAVTSFGVDIGDYRLVYPEDINVYGASFATEVADTNVSGEFSVRTNQPLAGAQGDVYADMAGTGTSRLYPVGRTFHGNVSAISVLSESSLWDGASIVGEIGYNRLLDVTNDLPLDRNVTYGAWGTRVSFEPSYFQVLPRVDITTPISVGYGIAGRSALGPGVFGPEHGGDLTLGVNVDWAKTWKLGLQYTNFFGAKSPLTRDPTIREYSYRQMLADRDYVSFTAKTTF